MIDLEPTIDKAENRQHELMIIMILVD